MIKTFENFHESLEVVVMNPEADSQLSESLSTEETMRILELNGFFEYEDYLVMRESLTVKFEGTEGDNEMTISVNGHKYGYSAKEGGLDMKEIAQKFEKMLQFSAGRALNWLKKNTVLVSGSKSQETVDAKSVKEGHDEHQNYMFFGNLKTIQKCVKRMMQLDPAAVDQLLENGHDWANDHIATSKDDIEEVCNWLCNQLAPITELPDTSKYTA
jgi:hypothetical protein